MRIPTEAASSSVIFLPRTRSKIRAAAHSSIVIWASASIESLYPAIKAPPISIKVEPDFLSGLRSGRSLEFACVGVAIRGPLEFQGVIAVGLVLVRPWPKVDGLKECSAVRERIEVFDLDEVTDGRNVLVDRNGDVSGELDPIVVG